MVDGMLQWDLALDSYKYDFDLSQFKEKDKFPNFFNLKCGGKRKSTICFENYFQKNAPHHIEVYMEVLFWKLYSIRKKDGHEDIFDFKLYNDRYVKGLAKSSPLIIWQQITNFKSAFISGDIDKCRTSCREIAKMMNVSDGMMLPLCIISFSHPDYFPIVDKHVISWINGYFPKYNDNRLPDCEMMRFSSNTDFIAYIRWAKWCQDTARILNTNKKSRYLDWRPRDVEMAVFSYQRNNLGSPLEIL